MNKIKSGEIQEEINITTNTAYLNEKSLEKNNKYAEYAFYLITTIFISSIFVQFISLIPNSFNIAIQLPIIVLTVFLVVNIIIFLLNKKFTLKVYLLIAAIVFGLVIGL